MGENDDLAQGRSLCALAAFSVVSSPLFLA